MLRRPALRVALSQRFIYTHDRPLVAQSGHSPRPS